MYSLIDFNIYYAENRMWHMSATGHANVSPGDFSPEECGNSEEFDDQNKAIRFAVSCAEHMLAKRMTRQAAIFVEGDEIFFKEN